jgi:8-oxo-dGTP diphosphatase
MPLKPKYCAQCGQAVVTQEVHGRARLVCGSCGTVCYENPLPIAAAVVLNERREALLVRRRREPHQGMWCLPMGFAELNETIAEAALRELHEEAGVVGQVVRLLDADSLPTDHYGDLLIVTFEVRKTGGHEQAGDDAEEVHYYPIGQHPPLAFNSNEKALRACAAAHQEGWEIKDSFVALQREEGQSLLSDALVAGVQGRAAAIAQQWLADLQTNPTTPTYRTLDAEHLKALAVAVISQFGRWLTDDEAREEVKAFARDLARERRAEGFRLYEVLSALALLKKHMWNAARDLGVTERPIDMYRLLELNRRVVLFFDKAMYQAAREFEAGEA